MAKRRLSVSIDEQVVEVLDDISQRTGQNRSQVLERLVANAITGGEKTSFAEAAREFFQLMATPDGVREFLKIVRWNMEQKQGDQRMASRLAKKIDRPKKIAMTTKDPKLPAVAKRDPMGPPKSARELVCLHCLKTFSSNEMVWDGELWCCKFECGGAGYGYDLYDADSDFGRGIREQAGIAIDKP